jgi:hypothetical protein
MLRSIYHSIFGRSNTNKNKQSGLTKKDKAYLADNGLEAFSQNRGKRTDASIDGIIECSLTRANTFTENTARLKFEQGHINKAPFALFRGVLLTENDVNAMLTAKSTLTFLGSKSWYHSHATCYAPDAKEYAEYKPSEKKSVVFIIPPNSISLAASKGNLPNILYHAFRLENTECHNVPIQKSWEQDGIRYIQLASPSEQNLNQSKRSKFFRLSKPSD